jgi:RNA polymerase sigma-70 factor (ECF subfamily)
MSTQDWVTDCLPRIATEQGDGAFRQLFDVFAPRIKHYMMRHGADVATAEELAQETLLAVWRKSGLYIPEKGAPAAWVFTIARNLRIDRLRKEVNWQELSDELVETTPSEQAAVDDTLFERQREFRVRAVLADLPADQREVVTLAFIDGLSQTEIAGRLALPLGTVKSRLRLAYQKVRDALKDLK